MWLQFGRNSGKAQELIEVRLSRGPGWVTMDFLEHHFTYWDQCTGKSLSGLASSSWKSRLTFVFLLRHLSQLEWTRCAFGALEALDWERAAPERSAMMSQQ